ncbi:galactokinase [Phytophthora nicotianae P1976]|uniref:Galactokinase n=1 Tax=Phytophthora nicotianae P1976 TaxID=1317066 RepID=A0A081AB78_PHYNI|nr:galactokinase [Phytophthora nicotianae P1976]
MDREEFRALSLVDGASERLTKVTRAFESRFGQPPLGVARAPGRVNLIGEHVDYEGYAVLPMAIEQSVYVAFSVVKGSNVGEVALNVANAKPQHKSVILPLDEQEQKNKQKLELEGAMWASYVLCGVLGLRDDRPEAFQSKEMELQMLVDGDIPAGCGLSSSSALVVASALATSSALQLSITRPELAELCRRAEHRVGTMGGGMDQAAACLAQRGVALHLDFSSVPARSMPVNVPDATAGVTFVVANSLVVAEKAVDAVTRFNKRVVECALAAKMIAKKAGIEDWRKITRLVDVQKGLEGSRDGISFRELEKLASTSCPLKEYSMAEIETDLGEPIIELFRGSSLEAAAITVIASASSFKLQQRALHVWGEAERVEQFQTLCTSLAEEVQRPSDHVAVQKQLQSLGDVMSASHNSCKELYECSCPELDVLVDAAMSAGALGARLIGAGWGGCIVALVRKAKVTTFMESIRSSYYNERGISSSDAANAMFESAPASGADIYVVMSN